jgi:hypothetical protein
MKLILLESTWNIIPYYIHLILYDGIFCYLLGQISSGLTLDLWLKIIRNIFWDLWLWIDTTDLDNHRFYQIQYTNQLYKRWFERKNKKIEIDLMRHGGAGRQRILGWWGVVGVDQRRWTKGWSSTAGHESEEYNTAGRWREIEVLVRQDMVGGHGLGVEGRGVGDWWGRPVSGYHRWRRRTDVGGKASRGLDARSINLLAVELLGDVEAAAAEDRYEAAALG